jgi:soluble lytic murein transglycosylase-like protein
MIQIRRTFRLNAARLLFEAAKYGRPVFRHIYVAASQVIARISMLHCSIASRGWRPYRMKHLVALASLGLALTLVFPGSAFAQRSQYDEMVARHAQANGVPVELVHRVIVRESRYRPGLVGRGGAIGMMQIKLATARGLGYTGTAEGLRDPETNLTYAVKYLAGAYRAANGNQNRAVSYYASGYYYVAKRQRHESSLGSDVPERVRNDVMPR